MLVASAVSKQVPQFLVEAGFEHIACTQPRRISAVSLCRRVAHETLNEFGSKVAYQIRHDSSVTRHTKIVFLTEGLVLRQVVQFPITLCSLLGGIGFRPLITLSSRSTMW